MSIADKLTTISNNLKSIANQKNTLVELLTNCGIEVNDDETLNSLVPKLEHTLKVWYELEKSLTQDFTNYAFFYDSLISKKNASLTNGLPTKLSPPLFTSKATEFQNMFWKQESLIESPEFDTSKGKNFTAMFSRCSSLTKVSNLDMSSAEICDSMFSGCNNLASVSLLNFRPIKMDDIFKNCYKLTQLPQIDGSRVTDLGSAFYNCSSLTHIPDINLTPGNTAFYNTFYGCENLEGDLLWLTDHDGYNLAYSSAFYNCKKLKSIGTIYVHDDTIFSSNSFKNCTALETIIFEGTLYTSGFNVQTATALSHDTLMSIVNMLADYSEDTSGTTYKVTFGETNLAKLTEEEKAIMDNKGWTYA